MGAVIHLFFLIERAWWGRGGQIYTKHYSSSHDEETDETIPN